MSLRDFNGVSPTVHESAFIDPTATVIGQVEIGAEVFVLPQVVIRGDVNHISIGAHTNIQDGTVIHVNSDSIIQPGGTGTTVGEHVTVGHKVLLHGCNIHDNTLIGMCSTVMDNVVVEENVMLAAGSLVTPGKRLESGNLYAGSPARLVRKLKDVEYDMIKWSAEHYSSLKAEHRRSVGA